MFQEELLEEGLGLSPSAKASSPRANSQAKDPNPWEASWGDLASSQESDAESDSDGTASSSSAGLANEPANIPGVTGTAQPNPAATTGSPISPVAAVRVLD